MLSSSWSSRGALVLLGMAVVPAMGCGRSGIDVLGARGIADAGAPPASDAGALEDAPNEAGDVDGGAGLGLQRGAPWPMFGQSPSLRGRSTAVGPANPTVKWFFPAAVTAQPAVAADGTIYFGTDDGAVLALGSDGSARWTFAGTSGQRFGGTPAIRADGSVVIGAQAGPKTTGQLVALSSTGALLWTYDTLRGTNGIAPSASIGEDGTIYASVGYHLYAVHPDGSAAWQADAGAAPSGPSDRAQASSRSARARRRSRATAPS